MSKDIPIIFSGPMVRALLDGRKTMTRRLAVLKGRPSSWQRVAPGDRLWVRENLAQHGHFGFPLGDSPQLRPGDNARVWSYDADQIMEGRDRRIPCIHMPRWASRLTLTVVSVEVEPLRSISEADAAAEGWTKRPELSDDPEVHRDAARDWFSDLWSSLHGVESWRANPKVVAIRFTVQKRNVDADQSRKQEAIPA